jgi:hypothetical protein
MATRTHKRQGQAPARAAHGALSGTLRTTVEGVYPRLSVTVASRRTRARLGMLGVPLAITAALMSGRWLCVLPLTACAWWWSPHNWGWEWLDAVGRGVIATEWAYMGAGALAFFPDERLMVGVIWAGLLAALAIFAARRDQTS